MKQTNGGFTLIELVVVIVILGILAAVAVPKFFDLSGEAETAAAQGVENMSAVRMKSMPSTHNEEITTVRVVA